MINPDVKIIHSFLDHLFEKAREEYPQGLIEIRYGKGKSLSSNALFGNNEKQINQAAQFAAAMNADGHNVYVGVNPRKPNTVGFPDDTDVEIAFWQFADLDKSDSLASAGAKMLDCPPTMTVTTGTIPSRRAHLYWELEEPVRNLEEWRNRQRGVADQLQGDSVINPSRVMRLAGTVTYPPQHKIERGYQVECSTFRSEFPDERPPINPADFVQAYPTKAVPPEAPAQPSESLNTLQAMVQRPNDVNFLIAACQAGDEWHNHMIRLVASLATNGRSDTEILALAHEITLPGYTVDATRKDMWVALQGARRKYAAPEGGTVDLVDPDEIFELFDIDQIAAMPPPSWLIHEMLVEDGLTILYGDPGAGKSFISLDMGLRLAHGMDWHGKATKPTGVLYIAGEGVRGIGKRIKGWRMKHGMEGVEAPFLLLPVAVEILDEAQRGKLLRTIDAAVARAGFHIGLIEIDTVSRALSGADENGQEAMGQFVKACDAIRRHANASVLGVHHSGKDKDKGMRGSTVLLGACDASIRVSKTEAMVTLKVEKQKDAEQGPEMYFDMEEVRWASGLEQEQKTLVPSLKAKKDVAGGDDQPITNTMIHRAFGRLADAWVAGNPLSHKPQTRNDGRYAPLIFRREIGGNSKEWESLIRAWLETECLVFDQVDSHTKRRGLRVQHIPASDQE